MTDLGGVTHLLFDHDGVLVDTEFWYFLATKDVLANVGITLTLDDYMAHMASAASSWTHLIDADQHEGIRRQRNERYSNFLLDQDIQIPGVENTLATLHGHYPMAIVTTSRREHFDLIHQFRNIVPYFDFVLTQEDYPNEKPAPDPYLAALEKYGINASEALVIEDSTRGLHSAMNAGIRCVIVRNEFTAGQDFTGATMRIDSLMELPALLGRRMPGLHRD